MVVGLKRCAIDFDVDRLRISELKRGEKYYTMKIHAIIQARMSSQRFPGKSLYRVQGKPMLQFLVESLSHCKRLDGVVVATSVEASDDSIAAFCLASKINCFRGPLDDVAGRFLLASETVGCDAFVRVNGDSPLLDYRLVDRGLKLFLSGEYDVVTNVLKRTFPKGESIEVVRTSVFSDACARMSSSDEREHVTRYFYNNSDMFKIINFESGYDYGNVQLSVDSSDEMGIFENMVKFMKKPHWDHDFLDLVNLHSHVSQGCLNDSH